MEQRFNQSLINISTEYSNLYTSQIRSAVTVDELFGKSSGAAYRPGPMQFLPTVREVIYDEKAPEYLSPLLVPILSETCGCLIYQEQLLRILTDVAGYTPEEADRIRAAVCKKKQEVIDAQPRSKI